MKRLLLSIFCSCTTLANADGAGQPPPQVSSSRTVPVVTFNFSSDSKPENQPSSGTAQKYTYIAQHTEVFFWYDPQSATTTAPFFCADHQDVFIEPVFKALRLTRRGEVFELPKLTKPDQYGKDGVSWVKTGSEVAELTLGRTQPIKCYAPQSDEVYAQAFNMAEPQPYQCAGGVQLWTTAVQLNTLKMMVVVTKSQQGQLALTSFLPQVRSASGIKYQGSQWMWLSKGREGRLERQGKTVAQQCRIISK